MKPIYLILVIILLLSIAGTIIFFPVKMNTGATCIGEKICKKKCDDCPVQTTDYSDQGYHNHHIVTHYIVPYGILWWLCIAVLVLCLYYLFNLNRKINSKN